MTSFAEKSVRERGSILSRFDAKGAPYLFITPFFVLFALVGVFPLAYTAWVSLHDWDLIRGQGSFVGVQNYLDVFSQRAFWVALRNTFSIFLLQVVPQLILALTIAALLDRAIRGAIVWRMIILLPFLVMPVAVTLIFNTLYADNFGFVNNVLSAVGIEPIRWHVDVLASHFAISTIVNYRWTGYAALIFLAGMQAIPRDYYEAATIDGAGPIRQFFSITIPQLRNTVLFVVVTATIGGLQIFDEPRLYDAAGNGGPNDQWLTLGLYLYNVGWTNLDFGQASAIAWILFVITVIVGVVNFALGSRIAKSEDTKR